VIHRTRRLALSVLTLTAFVVASANGQTPATIRREAWSFDNSLLEWYPWAKPDELKEKGLLQGFAGWVDYDLDIPADGWYELWQTGAPTGWTRDVFVDGQVVLRLHTTTKEDADPKRRGWGKEANLWLTAGQHRLRYRRLGFPGQLPATWELRASQSRPEGCIRASVAGPGVVRVSEPVELRIRGGAAEATAYELVARDEATGALTPVGEVRFPATAEPIERTVHVSFPAQGAYRVLAAAGGKIFRPADLGVGLVVAIDTDSPPPAADELRRTLLVDIDCVGLTINGSLVAPGEDYWQKDGETRVVDAPAGAYRESSGRGSHPHWATDGFSFSFNLPDADHVYQLVVDYPDDDRRTMGFWINDGVNDKAGVTLTGGVETGDRYRLSNAMQTHEAFFHPRGAEDVVVAVLNFLPGGRAAASRIRVYRVDSSLPAPKEGPLPVSARHPSRLFGYYFEESGRWIRHFGGGKEGLGEHITTMERWGQWCRYIGANLMFHTVNVYQANHYPSNILEGYFNRPVDECRINALIAEKYGCRYVPEFHLSGQTWFEKHVMGVWTEGDAAEPGFVHFASAQAEARVLVSRDGTYKCSWKPFVYNALHPEVQQTYIDVFGELADRLADCDSFAGISSRLMLSWQWMGWNALPGLNWGYGDWTVAEFAKDTGIDIPGDPGDASRFRVRYEFLMGEHREAWVAWRCERVFDFHRRLRDRLRQAKPSASLFFTYFGPDSRETHGSGMLEQMREIGMDWQAYSGEPGIVILPGVTYGRRFSTPVSDAAKQDPLYNRDFRTVIGLGGRGVVLYSDYFEVNKNLDWGALGGPPHGAFDCTSPSGIHERELYAISLANGDCSIVINGGNGWIFGTPSVIQPFLQEYRSLPAVPFTPLDGPQDPVAVWQAGVRSSGTGNRSSVIGQESGEAGLTSTDHRTPITEHLFYCVNRMPYPVRVTLRLRDAGTIISASTGQKAQRSWLGLGNTIAFTLEPYMLRAFRSSNPTATVVACETVTPKRETARLARMIAFAEQLRDDLRSRATAAELSETDARHCLTLLDESVTAFAAGKYWQAEGNLRRLALVRLYDIIGAWPPGLDSRKSPRGFVPEPGAPALTFEGEASIVGDARGHLSSVRDLSYDSDGNLWVASPEQVMQFGPDGTYRRSLRLALPHEPDGGGTRWGVLRPPSYAAVNALRIGPDGLVAAMAYNQPLCLYGPDHGRLVPRRRGPGIAIPGHNHYQLAVDARGHFYVACDSPPESVGVYKLNSDGAQLFDFGDPLKSSRLCSARATGLAVDAAGRIFVAAGSGIRIHDADGTLVQQLDLTLPGGTGRLAATPDGQRLFAAARRGDHIAAFAATADGTFAPEWQHRGLGATVSALAVSSEGELVLGFDRAVEGAVVRAYRATSNGIEWEHDVVPALSRLAPSYLRGFTQLKQRDGSLYFLADNRLHRLMPGTPEQIETVYDPEVPMGPVESFAFTPRGDLYLGGNNGFFRHSRGMNVYLAKRTDDGWAKPEMINDGKPLVDSWAYTPTDLAVDADGRLILRLDDPEAPSSGPSVSIFAVTPAGARERLVQLGPTVGWGNYGLHIDGQGKIYIAGGGTRTVACLSPVGKPLWETRFHRHQGGGSVPMRDPAGITTDSRGRVWVADPAGNRVLCFDSKGRFLRKFGHFGTIDDRTGPAFCRPVGIATARDPQGNEKLYVADINNQRIMIFRITDIAPN